MNRKLSLTVFAIVLALLISASGVVAQNAKPVIFSSTHNVDQPLSPEAFQRLWLTTNNNTEDASVAMDTAGGIHVGFSAYTEDAGKWPAYYAYCASDCTHSTNWTTTSLGNLGLWGGYVRLALDPAGHPRLFWYSEPSIFDPGVYQYAECSSSCINPSQWTTVTLASDEVGPSATRYFALDQQGHPRYLYTDTTSGHAGTYYVFCDSACSASAANWHEVQINSAYLSFDFSLAFTTAGGVRLAYRDATGSQDNVSYAECDINCNNAAHWTSLALYDIGSENAFSLRLDEQNRPRLAFYTGYLGSGDPDNDVLAYAWCNTACTQVSNWHSYGLGLPAKYGMDVDLALDQAGHPHLAYYVDDATHAAYGLGYAECTANCENSSTAAWQEQLVETTAELDASDPIPVKSGCSISIWLEVGQDPSLALDSAGNPRIGYTAKHYQGGTCTISEDMRLVRFALAGGGSTPPTAPASVAINNPATGVVGNSYTLTATVSPITATTPITYVWQATGQTTQTHTGRGASDTASFTWPSGATGVKTITVTVSNKVGTTHSSTSILIAATPIVFNHWVYLPAIRKP